MVTAMEDACPAGGQEDAPINPAGQPDVASVSTQPSRGEEFPLMLIALTLKAFLRLDLSDIKVMPTSHSFNVVFA